MLRYASSDKLTLSPCCLWYRSSTTDALLRNLLSLIQRMSACEYLPHVSPATSLFHQHSDIGKRLERSHREYLDHHLAKRVVATSPWTHGAPQGFSDLGRSSQLHGIQSDDSLAPCVNTLARTPTSSLVADANMEHRSQHGKVTLPPLSSLTTSIDLDRRHAQHPAREHDSIARSPQLALRNDTMQGKGLQGMESVAEASYVPYDRSWSIDRSNERTSRPVSAAFSPSDHNLVDLASISSSPHPRHPAPTSPKFRQPPLRRAVESTRPRSYSSPHRNRIPNATRRSSLADPSEVDQLLEALIYVQDINRRLGLATGGPASPSIFQNSGAARLLHDKLQEELSTMALFSTTRAESVASHLGLSISLATPRRGRVEAASQQGGFPAPVLSSGQAGHLRWPAYDPAAEGTQSSMGRLTLEERHHRDPDYADERFEAEFEDARGGHHAGRPAAYASRSAQAESSLRTISRAISFDNPRAAQHRHPYPHHFDPSTTEPNRFDMDARVQQDHALRHAFDPTGLPPMYHPDARHQQQMELLDRRRLAGKGMKRVRKRKNEHHQECLGCQAKETPEWRKGPMGPRTLCNACGLLYAKLTKRKQQEAEAAAKASGKTAEEIVREREESPGAKQASLEALRAELNLASGMRNRAASSSAPTANTNPGQAPPPSVAALMPPTRFFDGVHDSPPSSQPWPSQRRETFRHPFAHQPPQARSLLSRPGGAPPLTDHMDGPVMDIVTRPYSSGSMPATHAQQYPDEPHLTYSMYNRRARRSDAGA